MDFVALCGLPGVGKLTVARDLCAASGYRNFHNHLVVDAVGALFAFGSPAFVELREATWMALLDRALAEAALPGIVFTLAWDGTLAPDFLARLRARALQRGARFLCAELVCDRDELGRRVGSASRAGFGKLNDPEAFASLERSGAFVPQALPPDAIRIDTTELSPADTAARLLARFGLTGPDRP